MRKIVTVSLVLMLSACSTNYGLYSKGDERHGEYGYVSTYLAIAATAILISSAGGGGGGLYGGGDNDDDDNNGGGYGY